MLSLSFRVSYFLPIRPVMVSLPSIRGPSRCGHSSTWRLQVLEARRLFSRQVNLCSFWRSLCSAYLCVFLTLEKLAKKRCRFFVFFLLFRTKLRHYQVLYVHSTCIICPCSNLLHSGWLTGSIWITNSLIMLPEVHVTLHPYLKKLSDALLTRHKLGMQCIKRPSCYLYINYSVWSNFYPLKDQRTRGWSRPTCTQPNTLLPPWSARRFFRVVSSPLTPTSASTGTLVTSQVKKTPHYTEYSIV